MGVVDHHEHGPVLGGRGQEAERRGRGREPISGRGRPQGQSAREDRRLALGDLLQQPQERAKEIRQAGEGKLRFGLERPGSHDGHVVGVAKQAVHERRLPDPGVTVDDQGGARPLTCPGDQGAENPLFHGPAH